MNQGKETCNYLKAIRRTIAKENDIGLEIPVCTHQGDCPGTCPQCEAEVRHLETALAKRTHMGKAVSLAGIAMALASPVAAQEKVVRDTMPIPQKLKALQLEEPPAVFGMVDREIQQIPTVEPEMWGAVVATRPFNPDLPVVDNPTSLQGTVRNEFDQSIVAHARILCKDKEEKVIAQCESDEDGRFAIDKLPEGQASTLHIQHADFHEKVLPIQSALVDWSNATLYLTTLVSQAKMTGAVRPRTKDSDSPIPIIAQHGVLVTDVETHEPIPYALIRVIDKEGSELFRGFTNIEGRFAIEEKKWLEVRDATLMVEYAGHAPITIHDPMPKLKKGWLLIAFGQ